LAGVTRRREGRRSAARARRALLLASRLLTVYGIWQREGEVMHLVARRLVDHTALLDGLAARILGQRIRLGRPLRVQGLPQATTGSAFAAAVGLCLFAAHPQDEWWDFEIPSERYPARSLKRAFKWFKDNW
jgi:hypothetical protein